ncbi:hypothetical protein RRF57_012120 [Xylaria bambusicola]|uniref:Uncharacterized protein n=1 Tax=Xylaria bambusicola TaxID=326684 RepID=A0AAN7UZ40_9PEZI
MIWREDFMRTPGSREESSRLYHGLIMTQLEAHIAIRFNAIEDIQIPPELVDLVLIVRIHVTDIMFCDKLHDLLTSLTPLLNRQDHKWDVQTVELLLY